MVYSRKNVCFYPPKPISAKNRPDLTRPGTALTLCKQSFMEYRWLNDGTILMIFPRYLLIQATFSKSENGIWKLSKNAIEPLNLVLKFFKFQPQKMQKTWFLGVFHMFFAIFQHEKIITCNFDWPHQKVRQKCFKNHYWFSHYSLFSPK